MGAEYFGDYGRAVGTFLHDEIEGLLWTASCMRDRKIISIRFETDWSDLVDMTINPEDWPTSTTEIEVFQRLQEDFEDVNMFHILRSSNARTDALAKEARIKSYVFSHINHIRPDGGAPQRIGSSDHHFI